MGCIWITGLSGAGKTTLASALCAALSQMGRPSVHLDGDVLRQDLAVLGIDFGFERSTRLALAQYYARLACTLSSQGNTVVVSTVSLFHEVHEWNREHIRDYVEVLLENEVGRLMSQDDRGVYAGQANHESGGRVGLEITAEFPQKADLVVTSSRESSTESLVALILDRFRMELGV